MTAYFRRLLLPVLPALLILATALPVVAEEDDEEGLTPKARYMSGKLYLNQQVYDKAEEQLRLAVEGDPDDADYHAHWATALAYLGKERLAATSNLPNTEARVAAIAETASLFKQAGDEFRKAIELDPKKQIPFSGDNLRHFWVDLYKQADGLSREKMFSDALEFYRILTVLDPREPEGFFRVAYTTDKMDNTRDAVILALEAKEMAGERLEEQGDCSQFKSRKLKRECQKKIRELETIVENVDKFTRSRYVDLGYAAMDAAQADEEAESKRASLDDALLFFGKALEQDASLEGVQFNVGNAYFNKALSYTAEDTAQSYPLYRMSSRIFLELAGRDSVDEETKELAIYNAGNALYAADEYLSAHPVLLQYIDRRPRESDTWKRVAKCLAEQDKHADAISYLLMANALSQAEEVSRDETIRTVENLYANSDQSKALAILGKPDVATSFHDGERTVITWTWWSKGEARHFVEGVKVGGVTFKPRDMSTMSKSDDAAQGD